MKKLLSLFVLLVAIVTGAKADGATFTMSSIFDGNNTSAKVTEPVEATVSTTSTKSNVEIEGVAGQSLDINFEGEATAINNVNANENAKSAAPVKVIKNGKLYIGNYNVAGARIK